ncbi:MAG: hypothetical protein ACI8R8_002128 [Paraglaciecola sp.]
MLEYKEKIIGDKRQLWLSSEHKLCVWQRREAMFYHSDPGSPTRRLTRQSSFDYIENLKKI